MDPLRDDDPRTLGPFELRGRLGAGGMGVVYLAETAQGVEVAVKTVPRGVGEDVRVRLQREADLLKTIDHPRIARFVDADAGADEPWLAMRYVSGPSLSDAPLPLPPQQLRQLADGLAEALAALHKLGVTHRDVKPGNVIMTTHGAVLVDLGIAVTADAKSMTMAGTAVGSPAWMAPEQFAGDPAGPAADVWGWAAVLTYAATGHEPFGSGTLTALAHRIMSQAPNLQGVPEWLVPPVRAALTKAPDRRPAATDLVRGGRARVPFTAAAPAAPPAARPPAAPPAARPPAWGPSGPLRQPQAPPTGRPVAQHSGPNPVHTGRYAGPPPGMHPSGPQMIGRGGPPHQTGPQRANRRRVWPFALSALVVAAGVVVALVLLVGGSGGPGGDPTGTGASTATSDDTGITASTLQDAGVCSTTCYITGQVSFTHPIWGKVTLVSAQGSSSGGSRATAYLAVFQGTDTVEWQENVGPVYTLEPIKDPVDSLTHIVLSYRATGGSGIMVLAPSGDDDGITDYSTTPVGTDTSNYRFFPATAKKDSDEHYEIDVSGSDTPYTWNGSSYSQ